MELSTYRILEHCGPNNDDNLNYRTKKEINYWMKKCPIRNYKNKLLKEKVISKEYLDKIKIKIELEIQNSFKYAQESKFPKNSELYNNIYA